MFKYSVWLTINNIDSKASASLKLKTFYNWNDAYKLYHATRQLLYLLRPCKVPGTMPSVVEVLQLKKSNDIGTIRCCCYIQN